MLDMETLENAGVNPRRKATVSAYDGVILGF